MGRALINEATRERLVSLYQSGETIADLAQKIDRSRQRVQQILKEEGVELRPRGRSRVVERFTRTCVVCSCEFISRDPDANFCTGACARQYKLLHTDFDAVRAARREKERVRAYNYYHNVFKKRKDWQEKVHERNQKSSQKRRNRKTDGA